MTPSSIAPSDLLRREILFKKLADWMTDAFAAFGVTAWAVGQADGAAADALRLDRPYLFSPLLKQGEEAGRPFPASWRRLPVSTWAELQAARRLIRDAILEAHMAAGVDIIDPATTFIGPDVTIAPGVTILPGVVIRGRVHIEAGCELGPFTHIRPDVTLGEGCRIGAFVELKNSTLGRKTGAHHLTYVGDSDVGDRVNFGCGTVTVNYDGIHKYRTVVGDDAFIGCNTNLIAPVTVGAGAYTAAGSTVTSDVPPGALAIARQRQLNKEDWKSPKRRHLEAGHD